MIPVISSYGIHHYDTAFTASEISYDFGSELYGLSSAIHEAFSIIEQVCALTFVHRVPQNDEPRIEFGDEPRPGAFGEADLYVTDDLSVITGGHIALDAASLSILTYEQQVTIILHEIEHVGTGARDYPPAGPDQTIMHYGIFSQARGWMEAADIALFQAKYGASDDDNIIWGGPGTGEIMGGGGADTIYGNEGIDVLFGNTDTDWLHGGKGDDYIHGGQGNDTLWGGAGADTLIGGVGDDVIYYDQFDTVVSDAGDLLIYIGG